MKKALFIDMDGTIISTKSKEAHPKDIHDWVLYPTIIERFEHFFKNNILICIVSNQGGIEAGYFTEQEIEEKFKNIVSYIENNSIIPKNYIKYQYCPDFYNDSYYRKPNPGMAYSLALDFEIDLKRSAMVGDRPEDEEFAKNAGINTFMWAEEFRNLEN